MRAAEWPCTRHETHTSPCFLASSTALTTHTETSGLFLWKLKKWLISLRRSARCRALPSESFHSKAMSGSRVWPPELERPHLLASLPSCGQTARTSSQHPCLQNGVTMVSICYFLRLSGGHNGILLRMVPRTQYLVSKWWVLLLWLLWKWSQRQSELLSLILLPNQYAEFFDH